MLDSDLVRMANQIAAFFAGFSDSEALDGVRDHIMKFWTPSMRQQLRNMVGANDSAALAIHPLVVRAAALLS